MTPADWVALLGRRATSQLGHAVTDVARVRHVLRKHCPRNANVIYADLDRPHHDHWGILAGLTALVTGATSFGIIRILLGLKVF